MDGAHRLALQRLEDLRPDACLDVAEHPAVLQRDLEGWEQHSAGSAVEGRQLSMEGKPSKRKGKWRRRRPWRTVFQVLEVSGHDSPPPLPPARRCGTGRLTSQPHTLDSRVAHPKRAVLGAV